MSVMVTGPLFFFFFLKKSVMGICKLKDEMCTLAEKTVPAKERAGKCETTHSSLNY